MVETENKALGSLVQSYARARWSDNPDNKAAERLGAELGGDLRDRIDVLGADAERLLAVEQEQVMQELQTLEKEAALEDAGVRRAAARVRAREEMNIHDPAEASRRNDRMPAGKGKLRQPARHGRGRQRGQR